MYVWLWIVRQLQNGSPSSRVPDWSLLRHVQYSYEPASTRNTLCNEFFYTQKYQILVRLRTFCICSFFTILWYPKNWNITFLLLQITIFLNPRKNIFTYQFESGWFLQKFPVEEKSWFFIKLIFVLRKFSPEQIVCEKHRNTWMRNHWFRQWYWTCHWVSWRRLSPTVVVVSTCHWQTFVRASSPCTASLQPTPWRWGNLGKVIFSFDGTPNDIHLVEEAFEEEYGR